MNLTKGLFIAAMFVSSQIPTAVLYARTSSGVLGVPTSNADSQGVAEGDCGRFLNNYSQRVMHDTHTRHVIALFKSGRIDLSKAYETLRIRTDALSGRK